jgi:hypothetical protein
MGLGGFMGSSGSGKRYVKLSRTLTAGEGGEGILATPLPQLRRLGYRAVASFLLAAYLIYALQYVSGVGKTNKAQYTSLAQTGQAHVITQVRSHVPLAEIVLRNGELIEGDGVWGLAARG